MDATLPRVLAAAVDGRAQNQRFIQKQLSKLHNVIIQNSAEIRRAIRDDTRQTSAEVELHFTLALRQVRNQFEAIDFAKAIEEEFLIAHQKNAPTRVVPYGIAYISPSGFNVFYSSVVATAAAIAAGNCVVLQVS